MFCFRCFCKQFTGFDKVSNSLEAVFLRIFFFHTGIKLRKDGFEFQAAHIFISFFGIQIIDLCIFHIQFDRCFHKDLCKFIGKICQFSVFFQGLFRSRRFYLIQVIIYSCNTAKLQDQVGRCFLAYRRYTRNVIGRIAHQRFHIDKLFRCHLIFFHYIFRIIVVHFCGSATGLRNTDLDMGVRQLQQITVTGYDGNFHTGRLRTFCDRTENIVCLISLFCQDRHTHRL